MTLGIDNRHTVTSKHVSNDTQTFFNLQGLRVLTPRHGHIYIKGGRKIIY
ncbi:MAG: hypothetical protein K6F89_02580 [Prevotella sp.]|nr:hypothetical protein [Prevotella sp.]